MPANCPVCFSFRSLQRREQAEAGDDELDDGPVCSICYASRPEVVHQPCGHSEFCLVCSLQCDVCPLCRTEIDDRDELAAAAASPSAEATAVERGDTGAGGALAEGDEEGADEKRVGTAVAAGGAAAAGAATTDVLPGESASDDGEAAEAADDNDDNDGDSNDDTSVDDDDERDL